MDIEKPVQRAASLIARLREVDTDFRVYGADGHYYHLGPTLSEDELQVFESKHKIELPPDYRLFLKTVGSEGAGPDNGIYPLEETVGEIRAPYIHEPFPFQEQVMLKGAEITGMLEISDKGCSYNTHLVVKGPAYGIVWDSWEYHDFKPTGLSFTEWICDWAERAIPRVIKEKVTASVKEGMTLEEVIAICGDNGNRSHSLKRWTSSTQFLRFEGLATWFEVDERNIVVRIVNHSI